MKNESVLVTGVNGFIGKNLFKVLKALEPWKLDILDDELFENLDWTNSLLAKLNELDPTVIFHVGACSNTLETDVNLMFERNYHASQVILDWARVHQAKVIYSSSAANDGTNGVYPSNLYGWSKYVAEKYASLSGAVSLRYFNVYGPGEELKGPMASMFLQAFLLNSENNPVKLFPGSPIRDFVYIGDVISANLHAYQHYNFIVGGVFEVGSGKSETFERGMELMGYQYTYREQNEVPKGYQYLTKSNVENFLPGWKPNYDLELGLQEYKNYLESSQVFKGE